MLREAQLVLLLVVGCWGAPRIKTRQGTLEGLELDLITGNGTYFSFKGVPYSRSPVNKLRFKEPQPPLRWRGVRKAYEHGPKCYQYDFFSNSILEDGSEDCLYLNVYTPPNLKPAKPYPVMVFIHGGIFISGSGDSDYYSPDFLIPNEVILVTLNYRLEVFGFLSLQNKEVPGNNGMKDQVAALKWIKANIGYFGGDSNEVTIFGESAGSAAVGFLIVSPLSAGLFQRAIMMSGGLQADWAVTDHPRERAFLLGQSLGINTTDDSKLLKYLRSLPKEELILKSVPVTPWESIANFARLTSFAPVVEPKTAKKSFLTMRPEEYLTRGKINDVDLMIGYTGEEGIFMYTLYKTDYDLMNNHLEYFLTRILRKAIQSTEEAQALSKHIRNHYLGNKTASETTDEQIVKFYSWTIMKYSTQRFLRKLPKSNKPRFQYLFNAATERNFFKPKYGPKTQVTGVSHCDDLPYIFNMPVGNLLLDKDAVSYQVIQKMTALWTNFAKFGNPTPDSSLGVKWKPWTQKGEDYMEIGTEALIPGTHLESEEWNFWDDIYTKALGNRIF